MGEQKVDAEFAGPDRRRFMRAILRDLQALEAMLSNGLIEEGVRRVGAEQEVFLVDRHWHPAPASLKALELVNDPHFTTELGLFQLECNLDPQLFGGDCFRRMEHQLSGLLGQLRRAIGPAGLEIVLTGILPSLRRSDLGLENMVPNPRYQMLNRAMTALRGQDYEIAIEGADELRLKHDSVMVEACNTSFQVHLQSGAAEFPNLYNIAQALAGPLLSCCSNSPLLFGRRLWTETRIALFEQAVDTRSPNHERDVQARVSFGDRWLRRSVVEIYREDVARFRTLVGGESGEDPMAILERGGVPELRSLRLHNGTVYRWNRACYGVTDGKPHLRIENRVLPSGPSVTDEVANGAFWYGCMLGLAAKHEDITKVMEFEHARANFTTGARYGLGAPMIWLDGEEMSAPHLVLDHLLPLAEAGLRSGGVDDADRERYLGVIERRVRTGRTGARWLLFSLAQMKGHGTAAERLTALTSATAARQQSGATVESWEPAQRVEAGGWKHNYVHIEQYMSTDLYTVQEDDPVELAANLMQWHGIRHVPVEDQEHRLVGLVSYRSLLRLLTAQDAARGADAIPVSEVMHRDPFTVAPGTTTMRAIELMNTHKVGCLPVVHRGRLVGMITPGDFADIASQLLKQKLAE